MYLTETHKITVNNSFYKEIDNICFLSKNLYNKALYTVRQTFIETSKNPSAQTIYLNYNAINRMMIDNLDVDYVSLPRKVSNQTLMKLDKNWKAFFASIKDWSKNKGKYNGMPKIPKYLDKTKGRFITEYELGTISKTELSKGFIKLSGTNIIVPFINKDKGKLKCVRLVPTKNDFYKVEIIYEVTETELNFNKDNILSIDLGVTNLITLTSNINGFTPLIVNGGKIKSVNQFYNKEKANLQSMLPKGIFTSKAIKRLTRNRENTLNDEFHKMSRFIINLCKKYDIGTIVIGKNDQWKQEVNLGDKTNQNFCYIPYNDIIFKIKYKGELIGIETKVREESYTSKASFLDLDVIPTYHKGQNNNHVFSGNRKTRSFYVSGKGIVINADVNGSYNIMRKELIESNKGDFNAEMIGAIAVLPVRVKSTKEYVRFL